jgi:uncharacterized protein HemY
MKKSLGFLLVLGLLMPGRLHAADTTNPKADEIEKLYQANEKRKAEKVLDKWMQDEKNSPWPWVESGSLRFREKKYKKALKILKTALDKSPQCAEAYYWRGRSYEAMNKPLDAANEYRAALLAKDQYADAQEALTRVQAQLGAPAPATSSN